MLEPSPRFSAARRGAGVFRGRLWRLHQPRGLPLRREPQRRGGGLRARRAGAGRAGAAAAEALPPQPPPLLLVLRAQGGAPWPAARHAARRRVQWEVCFRLVDCVPCSLDRNEWLLNECVIANMRQYRWNENAVIGLGPSSSSQGCKVLNLIAWNEIMPS